jgi:hypothetical protein
MNFAKFADQTVPRSTVDRVDRIVEAYKQALYRRKAVSIDRIVEEAEPLFAPAEVSQLRLKLLATLMSYHTERGLDRRSLDNLLLE